MMKKHNPENLKTFEESLKDYDKMSEQQLLDALNKIIVIVENDDSYNTNAKLTIYAFISSLSNCDERERKKWVKKIAKLLK